MNPNTGVRPSQANNAQVLTNDEARFLAAVRNMDDERRIDLLGFMEDVVKAFPKTRRNFQLIAGGAA